MKMCLKIAIIFFETILVNFPLLALEKQQIGSPTSIEIGSPQYMDLSYVGQSKALEQALEQNKQEFIGLVEKAAQLIRKLDHDFVSNKFALKWADSFRKSQLNWLEQLELDAEAHWYALCSLGGAHHYHEKLYYMLDELKARRDKLNKGVWLDYVKNYL